METKQHHINLDNLRKTCGNDDSIMAAIFTAFLEKTLPSIEIIEKYCENNELSEVKKNAHRIKASFFTLGAKSVGDKLGEIEELATTEKDLEKMKHLINEVKDLCQTVYIEVNEALVDLNQ